MNNTKICCNCKFFKNSTHYCRCLDKETSCKDTCGSFEFPKPIDWEQRRYEVAKDVLTNHTIHGAFKKESIEFAIDVADKFIKKLKQTDYET